MGRMFQVWEVVKMKSLFMGMLIHSLDKGLIEIEKEDSLMATSGTQDHRATRRTSKKQLGAERRGSNPVKRAKKVTSVKKRPKTGY